MGGLVAVSQGSYEEPRLITLRHSGRGSGDVLGIVGKAVTFDSGGISIKPSAGMHEMKMDMSGGAAVIEAMGAIAELGIDLDIVAVVPSTENMPSGRSMRPGDIITQLNGKTVEVNNTDAEGRLILADALTWCVREQGAARVVDLATLTGAALIALGSTYSALISNDDEFADDGRRAWRRRPASWRGACRSTPTTRSSPRARWPTSPTQPPSARPGRSTPARSWRNSSRRSHGCTWTSQGPHGTQSASTPARAQRASECGFWSLSRTELSAT